MPTAIPCNRWNSRVAISARSPYTAPSTTSRLPARYRYLSLNAFIEEGTEIALLERIVISLAAAAEAVGVKVVAGDTKVMRRGAGGGIYLATTGVGMRHGRAMDMRDIRSDASSVLGLAQAAMHHEVLRFMRDPTRGGLVCEMLGYDPLYLACEGRIVAVVDAAEAEALLDSWQALSEGKDAAIIGRIDGSVLQVVLETPIGGERILEDDPLPRIC